eukprot:3941461-Rhodomonas_salina.1
MAGGQALVTAANKAIKQAPNPIRLRAPYAMPLILLRPAYAKSGTGLRDALLCGTDIAATELHCPVLTVSTDVKSTTSRQEGRRWREGGENPRQSSYGPLSAYALATPCPVLRYGGVRGTVEEGQSSPEGGCVGHW